jgi:hypothetical protein
MVQVPYACTWLSDCQWLTSQRPSGHQARRPVGFSKLPWASQILLVLGNS